AGSSGGILCVWEATIFKKDYATVSDNFIAIYGTWISINSKVLIVVIYAPQSLSHKRVLWDYISSLIARWNGETIVMGDFNEVRSIDEQFGLMFNQSSSRLFNHFITSSGLVDVKLEGYSFTWAHPSATKMSKLDRFLVSKVWNCGENKSLGPDGYTFEFFRRYWRFISSDFCSAVECFFESGSFPKGSSSSFIDLIPKVIDAKFVTDFRPISLIGCVYKVVTKILANRLATVISDLFSDIQSAFVANRQILDGPFILNELLAWCKRKKKQAMIFKVDFAKAYDSVRWDYLLDVLQAYIIGAIRLKDRLAPYLFILIMESLHISFSRATSDGLFKGFDFVSHCKKRVGDGHNTRFWYDFWVFDQPLRVGFPRLFALETDKELTWDDLNSVSSSVTLSASKDRWICNLNGDGVFRVKEVRTILDDIFLPSAADATRWVKYIPIKINVFAWRARLDHLPTISNLIRRGVVLDFSLCPLCGLVPKDIHHVLFRCDTAKLFFRRICRWWDLDWHDLLSFSDWNAWFSAIRLPSRSS
nr:RNA-directed DNA polymerase, eukaryota [Tanacetum cinerariifolium]